MIGRCILLACVAVTTAISAPAQSVFAPDAAEPGSVEDIARATTEARFLSPWVSYLPASSTVPSPRVFLGRIPGAPGELVDSAKAYACSRALAASSPRVRMFTIGRSEEGRDIILLAIADEKGIQNLDALKAANAALADPRTVDAAAAVRLIADSRPFYYFNAALHSDETGSRLQSRRARRTGRVVLSVPEGQNRSRYLASTGAAVLVQVRLCRHQSRRSSIGA
jgi:hypothetical protein